FHIRRGVGLAKWPGRGGAVVGDRAAVSPRCQRLQRESGGARAKSGILRWMAARRQIWFAADVSSLAHNVVGRRHAWHRSRGSCRCIQYRTLRRIATVTLPRSGSDRYRVVDEAGP
ncbi:MAG: hypothetical protein ACRD4L_13610, partial [Pyrinomonadaceae bacterium]